MYIIGGSAPIAEPGTPVVQRRRVSDTTVSLLHDAVHTTHGSAKRPDDTIQPQHARHRARDHGGAADVRPGVLCGASSLGGREPRDCGYRGHVAEPGTGAVGGPRC